MKSLNKAIFFVFLILMSACNEHDKNLIALNEKVMQMTEAKEYLNDFDQVWQKNKNTHKKVVEQLFDEIDVDSYSSTSSKSLSKSMLLMIKSDGEFLKKAKAFYGNAYISNSRVLKVASHILLAEMLARRSLVMLSEKKYEEIERGADVFTTTMELKNFVSDTVKEISNVKKANKNAIKKAGELLKEDLDKLNEYFKEQFNAYEIGIEVDSFSPFKISSQPVTVDLKPLFEVIELTSRHRKAQINQEIYKFAKKHIKTITFSQINQLKKKLIELWGDHENSHYFIYDKMIGGFMQAHEYNFSVVDFTHMLNHFSGNAKDQHIDEYLRINALDLAFDDVSNIIKYWSSKIYRSGPGEARIPKLYRRYFLKRFHEYDFKMAVKALRKIKTPIGNQTIEDYFYTVKNEISVKQFKELTNMLHWSFSYHYDGYDKKYEAYEVQERMKKEFYKIKMSKLN